MPYRSSKQDTAATKAEFALIKSGLKVVKQCNDDTFYDCWVKADTLCGGSCATGNSEDGVDLENGYPVSGTALDPFIDASGRTWATYSRDENLYLVDTNGPSGPNRFGKDRWIFTLANAEGTRVTKGVPVKVIPYATSDITAVSSFCKHPPCYYYTWLYER